MKSSELVPNTKLMKATKSCIVAPVKLIPEQVIGTQQKRASYVRRRLQVELTKGILDSSSLASVGDHNISRHAEEQ